MQMINFVQAKTKAAMFRSRARWAQEGERSSKYYFSLKKANYNKKVMTCVQLEDGSFTTNPRKILGEQERYYADLYRANPETK